MKVDVDQPKLQTLMRDPRGMVGQYFNRIGAHLKMLAILQAGFKTGATKREMFYNTGIQNTGLVLTVGSDSKVALMHHEGTPPHKITPRNFTTLKFLMGGRIVYAKVVKNRGTRPNRYLTDNLRRVL